MVVILPDEVAYDAASDRLSQIRRLRRNGDIVNFQEWEYEHDVLSSLADAGREYDLAGLTIEQARRKLGELGVSACGTAYLAVFDDQFDEPGFVIAPEDWVFGLGRIQCEPGLSLAERARLLGSPSVQEFLYFEVPAGVEFYDASRAVKPVWRAGTGELHYRGVLIKRYRQIAFRQKPLLDAFEAQGWPPSILNPAPIQDGEYRKGCLRQTVKDLMKSLSKPYKIIFECDGTGNGVVWGPASLTPIDGRDQADPKPPSPAPTLRRQS